MTLKCVFVFIVGMRILFQHVHGNLISCNPNNVPFVCDPSSPNHVIIYGVRTACPADSVCNFGALGEQIMLLPITKKCKACLPYADMCGGGLHEYTCKEDKTKFEISKQTFTCPKYTVCVEPKASNTECSPCKVKRCSHTDWKCEGDYVVIDNVKGYCPTSQRCNSEYTYPCTPCIGDDAGSIIYPLNSAPGMTSALNIALITFASSIFLLN